MFNFPKKGNCPFSPAIPTTSTVISYLTISPRPSNIMSSTTSSFFPLHKLKIWYLGGYELENKTMIGELKNLKVPSLVGYTIK